MILTGQKDQLWNSKVFILAALKFKFKVKVAAIRVPLEFGMFIQPKIILFIKVHQIFFNNNNNNNNLIWKFLIDKRIKKSKKLQLNLKFKHYTTE